MDFEFNYVRSTNDQAEHLTIQPQSIIESRALPLHIPYSVHIRKKLVQGRQLARVP